MKIIQAFWMIKKWDYKDVQNAFSWTKESLLESLPQERATWLRKLLIKILELDCPDYVLGMSFLWKSDEGRKGLIIIDKSDPTFVLWKVDNAKKEVKIVGNFKFGDLEQNPTIEFFEENLKIFQNKH